ncbi:hypothetical protein RD125_003388 [Salmonella enterica]|nr:hypothetical protein [Salmonella enterica]
MALIPSWSSSAHTASFSPFTKPPGGTRHRNSITGNYCFQHDFLAPILSGLFVTDVVAMVISSIKTALLFDLDHLNSFFGESLPLRTCTGPVITGCSGYLYKGEYQ